MLGFCFLFLKILCITVLSILGLILLLLLLVLFAPIRYKSDGSKCADELYVKALFTYLNPIVRVKVIYSDKAVVQVKFLGITVSPIKSKKKTIVEQKENKVNKEGAGNRSDKAVDQVDQHTGQPKKQTQKQDDAKSNKMDTVLYYTSLFAENKELVLEVCHIIFKAIKTILPRDCRVHATFGTGRADITGYIYAIYCGLQDVLPGEIYLEPIWTETQCEGEYYLKGKIRCIHLLIAIIKIFANKQVRTFIKKLRRV